MDATEPRPDLAPLKPWERRGLYAFFALFVVFGVILEIRCVFLPNRQTDLGVYLRAAWAARVGVDPYSVTDDNGWHYCYPPVVAQFLMPLADAPAGAARDWMLPWALSVMIWYLLSLACLFLAVHWIAKTLEASAGDAALANMPVGCRRWWFDRVIPVVSCSVQIGGTLARGQVTLIIILCVAGAFAAVHSGRRWRAGLWLGAAICLKIIPAFLLLYPLWRRDGRMLAGAALALVAGFMVLPSLYWGVPEAWRLNQELVGAVLQPGLRQGGDQARAEELTNITATDNQSIQAILNNYHYWGRLDRRPGQPEAWTRTAHWLIGAALTLAVLVAAGWHRDDDPIRCSLFLGSLVLIMTLVTPVSHLHYFSIALPLIMGLSAASLRGRTGTLVPHPAMVTMFVSAGLGYALPSIPIWANRREAGLPLIVSLVLLVVTIGFLHARRRRSLPHRQGLGEDKLRQAA